MNGTTTMVQNVSHHFSPPNNKTTFHHSVSKNSSQPNSSPSMQPPSETFLNGRKIGLHVEKWLISETDRRRYGAVFRKIAGNGRKVSGQQVRDYFVRFQLPQHILRDIWEVADEKHEGELDEDHFSTALHLLERVLRYSPMPTSTLAVATQHPMASGPTYKPPVQLGLVQHASNQNSAIVRNFAVNPPPLPSMQQLPPRFQSTTIPVYDANPSSRYDALTPNKDSAEKIRASFTFSPPPVPPPLLLPTLPSRNPSTFSTSAVVDAVLHAPPANNKSGEQIKTVASVSPPPPPRISTPTLPLKTSSNPVPNLLNHVATFSTSPTPTVVHHHQPSIAAVELHAKSPEKSLPSAHTVEYERLLKELDAKRKIRNGLSKRCDKLTQKLSSLSTIGVAEQAALEHETERGRFAVSETQKSFENMQIAARSTLAEIERLRTQRNLLANRKVQLVSEKASALQEMGMLHALEQSATVGGEREANFEPILKYKREMIENLRRQVSHAESLIHQRQQEVSRIERGLSFIRTAMNGDKQQNEFLCKMYANKQTQIREKQLNLRHKMLRSEAEKQERAAWAAAQKEVEERKRREQQFQCEQQQQQQQLQQQQEMLRREQQNRIYPALQVDSPAESLYSAPPPPANYLSNTIPHYNNNNVPLLAASVLDALYDELPTTTKRSKDYMPAPVVVTAANYSSSGNSSMRSNSSSSSSRNNVTMAANRLLAAAAAAAAAAPALLPVQPQLPAKSDAAAVVVVVRPAPPPPSLVPAASATITESPPLPPSAAGSTSNRLYANVGVVAAECDEKSDAVYDVPKSLLSTYTVVVVEPPAQNSNLYTNVGVEDFSNYQALKAAPLPASAMSPVPTTPGLLFVAVQNYPAVADDELSLSVGDLVQVIHLHRDKWWYGKLLSNENENAAQTLSSSSSSAGYFPASAVQRVADTPLECIALYDFEARNEDELSFYAGERLVLITARSETNVAAAAGMWALARPVEQSSTRLTAGGLVPVNYLSEPLNFAAAVATTASMSPRLDDDDDDDFATSCEEKNDVVSGELDAYDREFDDDDDAASVAAAGTSSQPPIFDAEEVEQLKKRSLAVDELVSTEKSYNAFLHAVLNRFSELFGEVVSPSPSVAAARKASSPHKNVSIPASPSHQRRSMSVSHHHLISILNSEEFDMLFNGWNDLAQISDLLLLRWSENVENQPNFSLNLLTNEFMRLLPQMQSIYSEFCARQVRAITFIRTKCQQNESFDAAVKQFSAGMSADSAGLRGCSLEAAFVRPLERITRYPLLIKRILSLSLFDAAECAELARALTSAETVCARINEGVGERESSARLEWLNQHVQLRSVVCRGERLEDFSTYQTNSMGQRQLLFFGTIFKSRSGKELVAFLFNDFLLFTTPQTEAQQTAGQFSFDAAAWKQQQLKPYKMPIMLDRMRVRASAEMGEKSTTTTIYEQVDECSLQRGGGRKHKSNSLSRKSSMRRKLSFDHASSMRGNATFSDLGGGLESSGSANDIFTSSAENLASNEFIVQSSDGLQVRLKALSQNECRNWVRALRQAAADFSRKSNDRLRLAARAPVAQQARTIGRCRMQLVAAHGLRNAAAGGMALGAGAKTKCVCVAKIGAHLHTSPSAECVVNAIGGQNGVCRWNDTFSLPFSQRQLDDVENDGKIVFEVFNCCVFRPDRLLGGCALKVRALVEQCEAKRGPVTLRVPLAKIETDAEISTAEIEIKADVRLLSSESQVMLASDCLPIEIAEHEHEQLQKQQKRVAVLREKSTKRNYVKLDGTPHSRF